MVWILPFGLLVSKVPGRKVTAENWRVICTCQRHRSNDWSLIAVQQLRAPFAAFALMSSLVLLGTTFPIEAMNLASLPLKLPTALERQGATAEVAVMTQQVASAVSDQVAAVAASKEEVADDLRLLTTRVKEEFLEPVADEKHLISESIKEEFFRTEVPYGAIIYREARRNGLSPELVAAIVETESDFRPTLLSNKNAHGLMQLLPSTAALMGVNDLFNPSENVRAGTKYLRYLQHRFSDPIMMLAAYNAGEAVVRKYGGIPPYKETQNFVQRVTRRHERYQQRVAERLEVAETLRSALE